MKRTALALFCSVLVLAGCNTAQESTDISDGPANTLRDSLSKEFDNVLPMQNPHSSGTVTVNLVADAGTTQILEKKPTPVWQYNGSVPGPEIRLEHGQKLRLQVDNRLPEKTTIHFHGVRVPNAMDGVPDLTQKPIQPNESYTYEFTPPDAGTFWIHTHVNSPKQMEMGLYAPLIVEDAQSQRYSQDVTWVLDDWRLLSDGRVDPRFTTPADLMHDGRWGNVLTVNGNRHENLTVQPGERIRLRLINTANGRVMRPRLLGLPATVIAVDGLPVAEPFAFDEFVLAPGNRVDVDIRIPDTAAGKRYVLENTYARQPLEMGSIVVQDAPVPTPDITIATATNLPDWSQAEFAPVDITYTLNARRGRTGIEWTINDEIFGKHTTQTVQKGVFQKIRFRNTSARLHPMHLHGMFFKVLARDGRPVDEPFLRDTVLVEGRETVDVGVVPIDAGKWLAHCHILEHADAGMMTVLEVQ